MKLFANPTLVGNCEFSGSEWSPAVNENGERVYSEAHTGEFGRQCAEHCRAIEEAADASGSENTNSSQLVALRVRLFTDGTSVSTKTSACPIMMTLANFRNETQLLPESKTLVGFMPYTGNAIRGIKSESTTLHKKIFHMVYKRLMLLMAQTAIRPARAVIGGKNYRFVFVLQNLVLDTPEVSRAALTLGGCH